MVNHGFQKWREITKFHIPHRTMAFPDLMTTISVISQSDGIVVDLPTIFYILFAGPTAESPYLLLQDEAVNNNWCAQQCTAVVWDSCSLWYISYSAVALQKPLLQQLSSYVHTHANQPSLCSATTKVAGLPIHRKITRRICTMVYWDS